MNIEQRGITITQVPGLDRIEVGPGAGNFGPIRIDVWEGEGEGRPPIRYDIAEARELRDALSAAIEHAERMTGVEPSAPVRLFMPGQVLDGTEDLPIGTVIQDRDDDRWHVKQNGKLRLFSAPSYEGIYALSEVAAESGPFTIVSLP